jgi:hypothetical protein
MKSTRATTQEKHLWLTTGKYNLSTTFEGWWEISSEPFRAFNCRSAPTWVEALETIYVGGDKCGLSTRSEG